MRFAFVIFSLLTLPFMVQCRGPINYPPRVTSAHLLSIQLGMTKLEVKTILGEPVDENPTTFTYTKRTSGTYPMIWIHFDSAGVREVYVKEYQLLDDPCVYSLSGYDYNAVIRKGQEENLRQLIP